VVLGDGAVGAGKTGREAISIDLSMYGDPIHVRGIRCPFSTYHKHKMSDKFGESVAQSVGILIALPRTDDVSLGELLETRDNFQKCARYASKVKCNIPDQTAGWGKAINSYRHSQLAKFHKDFDSTKEDPKEEWQHTYDMLDTNSIPPCVRHCLLVPNDNLLRPVNLQTLVRVLLKMGWHPKHIAGLIRSKFERDYGWGDYWEKYDPATRAKFYVRMYAGAVACNLDKEEDLNCVSHQEKGYCWQPWCGFNLLTFMVRSPHP